MRPTAMLFRNLASMDVEESIRGNPIDGVILLAGCDKTTPAAADGRGQLRPADAGGLRRADAQRQVSRARTSAPAPTSGSSAKTCARGEMSSERFPRGRRLHEPLRRSLHDHGHGLDDGQSWSRRWASACRRTRRSPPSIRAAMRSRTWPGAGSWRWCNEDLRMSQILTREAFENAVRVLGAIGGSTNAVIHLLAIAGRLGVNFTLGRLDRLGRGCAAAWST